MSITWEENDPDLSDLFEESRGKRLLTSMREQLALQQANLILWIPVFLGIGIGIYFALKSEPSVSTISTAVTLSCIAWIVSWPWRHANEIIYGLWLCLAALFFTCAGIGVAKLNTDMTHTVLLKHELDPVQITGTVSSVDLLGQESGSRYILTDLEIEHLSPEDTPYSIRLKVRDDTGIRPGDRISALAGLNPPSPPVMPGAFDFQRFAYFKKIGGFGFSYRTPEIISRADTQTKNSLETIRQNIVQHLLDKLPEQQASVVAALMIGERSFMKESDKEDMRRSGLAHMLAISGLHVGLVAGILFFTSRLIMAFFPAFALRYPIKKYAALIAFIGVATYTVFVGAPIPTIRALIMTGLALLAIGLDRMPFSLRLVAIAAVLVLLMAPEALTGPSFQMSFSAVTALVGFYEAMRPRLSSWYRQAGVLRRIGIYFAGILMTSLIASLTTAPFVLYHFQQMSLLSLLGNVLAMPILAFAVMPGIVFSYILMPLGIDGPALWLTGEGVNWILKIAHSVSEQSFAAWTPPAWSATALIYFTCAGLLLILIRGWLRTSFIIPLIAGLIIIFIQPLPDILVSSSGKLMAVKDNGRLYVSSRVHDRFTGEVWARRYGQKDEELDKWNSLKGMNCGEWGCHWHKGGKHIAFAQHIAAHTDDCYVADIIVSKERIDKENCAAETIIDGRDLWFKGAHALYLNGRAENISDLRGSRPWTIVNHR